MQTNYRKTYLAAAFAATCIMFLFTATPAVAGPWSPPQSATAEKQEAETEKSEAPEEATPELKVRKPISSDGELKWKFTKGQQLDVNVEQSTTMAMSASGRDMNTVTSATNSLSMTIDNIDDKGVASATSTINRMKLTTTPPFGPKIEYDSAAEEEAEGVGAQFAGMLEPMIGKPMTQKMTSTGKIYDVEIPEEALEGMKSAGPGMGQMFSKRTFEEMVTKSSIEFPESGIEVGKSWSVAADINMGPMPVKTDTRYEYRGVADVDGKPYHIINASISMSFPENPAGAEIKILKEKADLVYYFDGNAGRLAKTTLDQKVEMEIKVAGQEMKQTILQKMVTKMTEKN